MKLDMQKSKIVKKQYVILSGVRCEGTKEQVLALKAKISEFVQLYWGENKRVKPAIIKDIVYELFDLHQDEPKIVIEELAKTMEKKIEGFKPPIKEDLNPYPTLFWDEGSW
jgi:hypothetical protein